MLNLTATDSAAGGFLTAYPCAGGVPATSSVNYAPGAVTANFVVVEPDADGDVCVFSLARTHVVVDLLGTTGAAFTGGTPQRLLDTRTANLHPPGHDVQAVTHSMTALDAAVRSPGPALWGRTVDWPP